MENLATSAMGQVDAQAKQPRFAGINHISLPCRDVEESKRFYTEVIGGALVPDIKGFAEVKIVDIIIGMSAQSGGWTGWDAEFPHYGFFADGESFLPMVDWLQRHGVKTPGPWTRDGKKGLMYFRDPSGNLFEVYCGNDLKEAAALPRGVKQGGSYETDFAGLFYEWNG